MAGERPPLRVLLVDENHEAALSLALLVNSWGGVVNVVDSSRGALGEAPGFHPDVVLVSLPLAGEDGCQLARQLRAVPSLQSVVLVALAKKTAGRQRQRWAKAGFVLHLMKPLNPEELRAFLTGMARATS
jgi:CheY-like chemotaxis protein